VTKAGVMAEIQVVVVAGQAQPRKENAPCDTERSDANA
jgi:hypothetical protein